MSLISFSSNISDLISLYVFKNIWRFYLGGTCDKIFIYFLGGGGMCENAEMHAHKQYCEAVGS